MAAKAIKTEYLLGIGLLAVVGLGVAYLLLSPDPMKSEVIGTRYHEIENPSGFVNTNGEPITIGEFVRKKVILIDFMTYSCINCQRTFPYLRAWHERYKDDGLQVIGIHTPEFAFEHDINNVQRAMQEFGLEFPIVLDNDYATWRAFDNHYWPRKYLIDINGNIVYDHIGEGAYDEIEQKIRELLEERAAMLGMDETVDGALAASGVVSATTEARSPETYFGFLRNEYLGNGTAGKSGVQSFALPDNVRANVLYLGGEWDVAGEHAEAITDARVQYRYNAKEVYIVAEADTPSVVEVWQDGKQVDAAAGADAQGGEVQVRASRLYKLIKNDVAGEHALELRVAPGIRVFAFTFG